MNNVEMLAKNITKYREERGLTLSGMSELCGISKSTLSIIESGKGNPTVETLWAIANVLDVSFGVLVSDQSEKVLKTGPTRSKSGSIVRLIERSDKDPEIEVYSVEYTSGYRQESQAHAHSVKERVTVISGALLVGDPEKPKLVRAGETFSFFADIPHTYESLSEQSKAIVIIEYPSRELSNSLSTIHLNWPKKDNDWDGAEAVAERLLIEVSQGIQARRLLFHKCDIPVGRAVEELRRHIETLISSSFHWPVLRVYDAENQTPYLAIIPLRFEPAFSRPRNSRHRVSPHFEYALKLARFAESPFNPSVPLDKIRSAVHDNSLIIRTLASETLAQHGGLSLTETMTVKPRKTCSPDKPCDERSFSSRIHVESYNAYELLHPAYARQVVAVAEDLAEFISDGEEHNIIDVGTGPGMPLIMLQELFPEKTYFAIEPDAKAFSCLEQNIKTIPAIECIRADFLELPKPAYTVHAITSFGSSHHFNTAFMLQKTFMLLEPGGILCVADEFLPEFDTSHERELSLIRHHSAYIFTAIAWINAAMRQSGDQNEPELYRKFRQTLTTALIEAESGNRSQAINLCRKLFSDIKKQDLSDTPNDVLSMYSRFFWHEFQAMIAGFDYEVEQKTYPKRFLELAYLTGFQKLRHRRIFATIGSDPLDGGTHVFTFMKPTNS